MVAPSITLEYTTSTTNPLDHMKGNAMIISHSEEEHSPITLSLTRKEYFECDFKVDFRASTLNNAKWEVADYCSDYIELRTYDEDAIRFAKELLEFLNGNTPSILVDGDDERALIQLHKEDYSDSEYVSVGLKYDPYENLVCQPPYDVESNLEVV